MGVVKVITDFLERLGGKTVEVAEKPIRRIPQGKSVQERLRALKELQKEIQKEKTEAEKEKELEEILEWRKKEMQRPFSERLADTVLRYFKGPVEALTNSLRGLDQDLYRASILMPQEKYVALMLAVAIFAGIFGFLFAYLLYVPVDMSALVGFLGFVGGFMYMRYYPRMVWKRRVVEVERAMPYALRHMASLLSAGVGISEALLSVARADYGVISEEFELILRDMRTGSSFEDALTKFDEKMGSENVSRVVKQILRAMKFGGNLSEILYKMAEDFAFEYRMKLVEYVQRVNGIAFIYMFLTIVMPTMFVVGILAGSVMAQQLIMPPETLAVILLFAFPALSFIVVNMIKKGEPR
ncbi:type II secretion system F family protein [Thermococcus thioreducens]|uniref:Flagellar protein FlaJ n=1 Tax=Thermococcus thioreducens TaxID=277988 RepID=A0A0Q2RHA9_9EURY|nr:type II secretion system F family protein [Thermococcus thioreducens]ASJ11419.1 type II secretion protein F [Thermococcus thioreducens]KQH83438.1 type II secretion protein F [Thermococcus thioreducens]SEW07075.1 flagellar protein FlaJ [Thermococcus thioreducens]